MKKIKENLFVNYETPRTNKASLGPKSIENTTEVVSAYFAREIEINKLKEDLKSIDELYIKLIQQLAVAENEKENLEEQLKAIEEDGTEEHNAAFDLRCRLAEALVENDKWKEVARKLYGVVLHLQEVSKSSSIVVVGSGLYSEAVEALNSYEKLNGKDS